MIMRRFFILWGIMGFCIANLSGQQVSDVLHVQSGQNIQISYSLSAPSPVEIRIEVSTNNGKTFSAPLTKVSGDVGKGITVCSKRIVWRVLEEVPELVGDGVVFRVSVISNEWRPGTVHCGTPIEIVPVYNPKTGKTWMDRNLGASRVATGPTDAEAYGDLYQWGRFADGHQCRGSGITSTISSADTPGHPSFIKTFMSGDDWRSPQNNNLWQGVNGINNPCPTGYRLPTDSEWDSERLSWKGGNNANGALGSPLKLPLGDHRNIFGSLLDSGDHGFFWSATVSGTNTSYLHFGSADANLGTYSKGNGYSIRCLQD